MSSFSCVLNAPLMLVIPPSGMHLSCPVHPAGHFVQGQQITYVGNTVSNSPSQESTSSDFRAVCKRMGDKASYPRCL